VSGLIPAEIPGPASRWGVAEGALAELYDALNAQYFDGQLMPVRPIVGLPDDAEGRDDLNGLTRL
jgi:hypothetical protein